MVRVTALIAVVGFMGCSDSIVAPVPPTAIVGAWRLASLDQIPGSSMYVILDLNDGTLSGNGQWSGEAGPFGRTTTSGVIVGDSVQLDITFTYDALFGGGTARHAVFSGRLRSESDLVGRLTYDGQPSSNESFEKFYPPEVLFNDRVGRRLRGF